MAQHDFVSYRTFYDQQSAMDFITVLDQHSIPYQLEDREGFDPQESPAGCEYSLKLRYEDFRKADEAYSLAALRLAGIPADEQAGEELLSMLRKEEQPDKAGFSLAMGALREPDTANMHEISQPEKNTRGLVFLGYIFALLGGVVGIFLGWHFRYQKKTLPDGSRMYIYPPEDRKHGLAIIILGIVCFIISILLRLSR